jgi:hypothetical protein
MEISKTNNNITIADNAFIKPAQNTISEDINLRTKSSEYVEDSVSIGFVKENHAMRGDNSNSTTYGVKIEMEKELFRFANNIFKGDSITNGTIAGGSGAFGATLHTGLKLKVGYDNIANAYVSGAAGLNGGKQAGSFTGGAGVRVAVGAEFGPLYAESFKEFSTNYASNGYTVGLRIPFD